MSNRRALPSALFLLFVPLACQSRATIQPSGPPSGEQIEEPSEIERQKQQVQAPIGLQPFESVEIGGAKLLAPKEATVAAFARDGRLLSAGGRDETETLLIWDLGSGEVVHRLYGLAPDISAISTAADADRVAAAGVSSSFGVWSLPTDGASGALLAHIQLSGSLVYGLALSPDGDQVAVGTGEGALSLWDVAAKTERILFTEADSVSRLAFSPMARSWRWAT